MNKLYLSGFSENLLRYVCLIFCFMDGEHKSLEQLPKNPQLLNYQTRTESKSFHCMVVSNKDLSLRASRVTHVLAARLVSFTLDRAV